MRPSASDGVPCLGFVVGLEGDFRNHGASVGIDDDQLDHFDGSAGKARRNFDRRDHDGPHEGRGGLGVGVDGGSGAKGFVVGKEGPGFLVRA